MSQVEQIGYRTTLADIQDMVKEQFGWDISEEAATMIMLGNNHSQLIWNDKEIEWPNKLYITEKTIKYGCTIWDYK